MKTRGLLVNCELDERQLLMRGNVYQHVVVILMALLLINGFLKDYNITWAEGMWENILIFWAGAGVGIAEFILQDINPKGVRQRILYGMFGACGGVLFILGGIHVLVQHRPLVENGMLTVMGAEMIQATVLLLEFALFLGKRAHDKKARDEE